MAATDLPTGTAVVCGGNHGALAIARSLGRRNIRVIVVTANPSEPTLRSRYVDQWYACPDPADAGRFADFMLEHADEWRGAVVFDTNDAFATAVSSHHDRLSEHYRLTTTTSHVVDLFVDKKRTYELAERNNVPYPRLVQPHDPAQLREALETLQFPAMVKPLRSHEFQAAFGKKLVIADDAETAERAIADSRAADVEVMLCEIIPGGDHRTLHKLWIYVDTTGEVAVEAYHVKLRQTPPLFGITRAAVTTPPERELRAHALSLIEASDLRGTAGFEFKRDPRTGRFALIEVNVRMMADVQLLVSAGVDVPWIMYQDHALGVHALPPPYEVGRYFVYEVPDIRRFVTDRDPPSVKAFLEPYVTTRRSYAFWSVRDPRPLWSSLSGRIGRRIRRRSNPSAPDSPGGPGTAGIL